MLHRLFTCKDVRRLVKEFFSGTPAVELAHKFNVSRATVSNILFRVTYKECYNPLDDFPNEEVYLDAVNEMMKQNRRRSKGRGRKKGAVG